jgi:uncharacterized membrane protein
MKVYWGLYPLFLILLAGSAFGAVIHGSVYDLDLNPVSQAVVEISTTPRQVMVSVNGTYKFSAQPGNYVITARHAKLEMSATENITVRQEGDYVLDFILFPEFGVEEELLNETLDVIEYEEPAYIPAWLYALVVLAGIAVAAAILLKKRKKAPEGQEKKPTPKADLEEILAFIRKEGGRTTQKDLRKAIPYSEAKISLMIAELESQGKVRKIKKGRGNIIILP